MIFNVVYGVLSLITWSAFFFKLKDLARDWRNRELQLLCLAIAAFAAPFGFASPAVYVRVDALLGFPNLATLIIYISVAICTSSFLALLVRWSSAESRIRLRHRLLVGYAVATIVAMAVLFFLGTVDDAEHPIDFDVYFAETPYISQFLLVYQLLFTVSMIGLIRLCWQYSKIVGKPWLRRGLRVVTVGAVFGLGYSLPKGISHTWDLVGASPLDVVNTAVAPMSASLAAALFAIGFTMPAWGVGLSRTRAWVSGYRTFRRRYPLWEAVTREFPGIVLDPPPASRKGLAKQLDFFLGRQAIEILDGTMRLRPYYDPTITDIVQDLASARGHTQYAIEAVSEATQIAVALRARAAGQEAPVGGKEEPHGPGGRFEDEETWLTEVATAFRASPIVPAVLEHLKWKAIDA